MTQCADLASTITAISSATDSIGVELSGAVTAADLGKAATSNSIIGAIKNTTASKVGLVVPEGANIRLNADCEKMFYECTKLVSADLRGFNTGKVTNMKFMFGNCSALITLDVSSFNTEKVTTMKYLFHNCTSLTAIDVSSFNTGNVTDMGDLFQNCQSLTALDVSNFNTSNVTYMDGMFGNCRSLTTLDVSSLNTSNVTDRSGMFIGCKGLTTFDLSTFNTEKVTNIGNMFNYCDALVTVDLSSFNASSLTNTEYMFNGCTELTTIYTPADADWSGVGQSSNMFTGCSKLKGGNGTTFDSSYKDAARAKVDGGSGNPGYFTPNWMVNVDGHCYVDLGTGTMWATTNIGATQAAENGDYFAWGETESKEIYSWATYEYTSTPTKYNSTDNLSVLSNEDDAATEKWGNEWQMPTKEQFVMLLNNCFWVWTSNYNSTSKAGYIVYRALKDADKGVRLFLNETSPGYYTLTTPHIFLPAAGGYWAEDGATENNAANIGTACDYWTSTIFSSDKMSAYNLFINSISDDNALTEEDRTNNRICGKTIRPVRK